MIQPGNVDVNHRPSITNDDGSKSSIFSVTVPVGKDGHSVAWDDKKNITGYALVPSIVNGKFLTPNGKKPTADDEGFEDRVTEHYDKTRQHLGIFKSNDAASKYADATHAYGNDGTDRKVFTPSY